MKRINEKGTAMLFAIILVLVLSVMAASMMFLSQSETWGSTNYRMMTQARYGAEAGVHAAVNFLLNTYVPPPATAGTPPPPPPGYNTLFLTPASCGGSPCVTDPAGNAIILSSLSGVPSNYPDNAQTTAFKAATNNTLLAGSTTVRYTASATLLSMVQITPYATTTPVMVQTWKITAHGDIAGVRNAQAEVSAILETPMVPAFGDAAFATSNGCGGLTFSGNGTTNSYDSASLTPNGGTINPSQLGTAADPFNSFGGNVGTNGNQTDSGANVTIYGTLSTPDVTVGACSAGNVTALTGNINQVKGGLVQLPQPVSFSTPVIPPSGPVPGSNITSGQTLGAGKAPCPANFPTAPCNLGDISLSGKDVLTLQPGTYNINSISESGQAQVAIGPDPITGLYGPVIINVTGANQPTPIDLSGQGISNPTYDPSLMQFNYAGTGQINIVGQGASASVVYAPNATASFKGNGAFYGSVIASQVTDVGNGAIHYDLKLKRKLFMVGNPTLNSFTWSKF